jgi:Flp pilus assembly pilin Flp
MKPGLPEYALIAALIVIVAIVVLIAFGDQINQMFGRV